MNETEFMEESIKEMTMQIWARHFKDADIEIGQRALELAVEIHFEEMCQYALQIEEGLDYGTGFN